LGDLTENPCLRLETWASAFLTDFRALHHRDSAPSGQVDYRHPVLLGDLLDGLFGLGGDGVRGVGWLVDLVGDALHAIFEAAETFAEAFAELWQLFAAEQDQNDYGNDDEMCRCK